MLISMTNILSDSQCGECRKSSGAKEHLRKPAPGAGQSLAVPFDSMSAGADTALHADRTSEAAAGVGIVGVEQADDASFVATTLTLHIGGSLFHSLDRC